MYIGVAAHVLGGGAHRLDHPLGDVEIGELQNEPIAHLAREFQRERTVCGDPDIQFAANAPREPQLGPVVFDRTGVSEFSDDVDRLAKGLQRGGRAIRDAHRRVAPTDAHDGAVAVHLVERRVKGCGDRPVTRGRIRDHGPDLDPVGLVQNSAVDHIGLLPEQVRVECPHVAESVLLRELGEVHRT
jgi:hypothetical protein